MYKYACERIESELHQFNSVYENTLEILWAIVNDKLGAKKALYQQFMLAFTFYITGREDECLALMQNISSDVHKEAKPEKSEQSEEVLAKPPIGIEPQKLFKEKYAEINDEARRQITVLKLKRAHAIIEGMQRYSAVGKVTPVEWADELYGLVFESQLHVPFDELLDKILQNGYKQWKYL